MTDSDSIRRMLQDNPLIKFSSYTDSQVRVLNQLGQQIVSILDTTMNPDGIDGKAFQDVYGQFWLWVLGAYEVVRTMREAKGCFSDLATNEIDANVKRIELLRMPFAKQELKRHKSRKDPISGEASVSGVDTTARDLSFEVRGEIFSMRGFISEFRVLLSHIGLNEILRDHRQSEAYATT